MIKIAIGIGIGIRIAKVRFREDVSTGNQDGTHSELMRRANSPLSIALRDGKLEVGNLATSEFLRLDWPSVRLSLRGKEIRPTQPIGRVRTSGRRISQEFEEDGIRFVVTVTLSGRPWFRKSVAISADRILPTPDFVEVDRQVLPADGLRLCGYMPTTPRSAGSGEEEGTGLMPGCGYPLIGNRFFVGLEHPAAFSHVAARSGKHGIRLRHHPVWESGVLQQVDEVCGWAENAGKNFADYLDSIRLPALRKQLVSFCTFWSDPYLGDLEYQVSYEAYAAFIRAFRRLGLVPDMFTLDGGWFDRRTVLQAKKEVGRDAGLVKLRRLAEKMGSSLSLWVTHNGPFGMDPGSMKKRGYEVGSGNSAAYCGEGYMVMMDRRYADAVEARLCELVRKVGPTHLKIDWDNSCATNRRFKKLYPTGNHVRQATLNVFFDIAREMRKINPSLVTRNGWWPSPWWLREAGHVFLPDSADSEFAALPSRTQRDAATTHRDLMYYNTLQRDGAPLPLDCFDNHEFPDAPRNPFREDPNSWVNTVWLSFLRGTSYITCTLMPESLEDWQVESLREIMRFCRTYVRHILVPHGKMILGHPGRGEVYGFLQPAAAESWCVLRNPLPVPQAVTFDSGDLTTHPVKTVSQFYPHYETAEPASGITFLAHEVKVLILSARIRKEPYKGPHVVHKKGGRYQYSFPASATVTRSVRPMVDPIQQLPALRCLEAKKEAVRGGRRYRWYLEAPYRMRDLEIQLCARGKDLAGIELRAFFARNKGDSSRYALPVTTMPVGVPGYGEQKNRDVTCRSDELYYAIQVPDGGQFALSVTLMGAPKDGDLVSAWIAGYEAPSRNAIVRKKPPAGFSRCLPYQHPLGFGRTQQLPLSNRAR